MAVTSNALLGIWAFASQVIAEVSRQYSLRDLIRYTFLPYSLQATKATRASVSVQLVLAEGCLDGLRSSWLYFMAAFLLTRRTPYSRNLGFFVSSGYSIYVSVFARRRWVPWANFFTVFANVLYLYIRAYPVASSRFRAKYG